MPWLVSDGQVLASLEVADTARTRARGLLGRGEMNGALLLQPARAVHTMGMRFPIDVAYCDREMKVLRVVTMRPHRLGRPVRATRCVVEAEAGSFERWGIAPGDQLEVRG